MGLILLLIIGIWIVWGFGCYYMLWICIIKMSCMCFLVCCVFLWFLLLCVIFCIGEFLWLFLGFEWRVLRIRRSIDYWFVWWGCILILLMLFILFWNIFFGNVWGLFYIIIWLCLSWWMLRVIFCVNWCILC